MKWLCRITTSAKTDGATVLAELVYGWEVRENGATIIKGEARHRLSGPTATASITELAEKYNREGKKPGELPAQERATATEVIIFDPIDWKRAQGRKGE